MDKNLKWYLDKKVERTIKNLEKHNMLGIHIKERNMLFDVLQNLIIDGTNVGIGDSMSLFELGVIDFI